jgi:hypothetical protein
MNAIMIQTSDSRLYINMLAATGIVNELYCNNQGISYRPFIGLKRGHYPWHATYNRILLLAEAIEDHTIDWVLYLDADAYVVDLKFSITDYLRDKQDFSLIVEPGTVAGKWDVNMGVFFLNLRHPLSRKLINLWKDAFYSEISDERLRWSVMSWSLPHDQAILQAILRSEIEILDSVMVLERGTINYRNGRYIRQVLRTADRTLDERITVAKQEVRQTLRRAGLLDAGDGGLRTRAAPGNGAIESRLERAVQDADRNQLCPESDSETLVLMKRFAVGLYRSLLLRDPDQASFAHLVNNLWSGRVDFESEINPNNSLGRVKGAGGSDISRWIRV